VHLSAERIVDVDVAGRAPNRMLRDAMRAGALVVAFTVVLLLHGGAAHADPAPPIVPIANSPLIKSVLEPVVVPLDAVVAPVTEAVTETVTSTATELSAMPVTHTVEALLTPAIAPVVQAPVVQPVVDAGTTAMSGLIELAVPVTPAVDPITDVVQGALFIEQVTTLFEPPTAHDELASTPSIAADPIVPNPSNVGSPGHATIAILVASTTTDHPGIERAAQAPGHAPSFPFSPAMPTPSAPGPSSGDVLRIAGHDPFNGALLAQPATGGTPWWLFVTTAFGWRSALVLSRLERPG
jgi:hypothetical protein